MVGFWDVVASAGPYANNLYHAPESRQIITPTQSIFTGWMLFLTPNQQCQSTEGKSNTNNKSEYVNASQSSAFSALTLLVGRQEGHPACKNRVVGCCRGYLSGVRCRLAYMPSWCHCHSLSRASVKSRLVLPFWYRPTLVVLEKGPLNGCVYHKVHKNKLAPAQSLQHRDQ